MQFSVSQTVDLFPNAVYQIQLFTKQSNPSNCYMGSARLGNNVIALTGAAQSSNFASLTGMYCKRLLYISTPQALSFVQRTEI